MRILIAGVAAISLAAGTATANPGNGNGKGPDKGKPVRAQSGGAQGGGPKARDGDKGPGKGNSPGKAPKTELGNGGTAMAGPPQFQGKNANPGPPSKKADGNGSSNGQGHAKPKANLAERGNEGRFSPGNSGNTVKPSKVFDDGRRYYDHDGWSPFVAANYPTRNLINGCPPGLAKKHNGCQPPGQARKDNDPYWNYRPDWWGYSRLGDGRYFYRDGYLLRIGRDGGIGSYLPLLGGALAIGNAWPNYYSPVSLPPYYESYYGLGPSRSYRYADDVIYRVDPETAAITSIAALLTGNDFSIGSAMPAGYDVYNVPYPYRQSYYDRPDAWYRYNDGYIYEVDPETRLIAAAIEMIAS